MCGICGVLDCNGELIDGELVARMAGALQHRGPDGSGLYISREIGLGHRRLSIIDLDGGAQPITNEDSTLHLVFNGEIYNFIELREELLAHGHVFKTRSDTEVIIHSYEQWGPDCVSRFNGMFAIALWDSIRKQLFLARDHLGVKPLYYTRIRNKFLFASEIKALLMERECPRAVDLRSLSNLFTLRYVPSPDTMFRDIKKIPPGHWMIVGSSGVEITRYWKWVPTLHRVSRADLIEQYQELLEDAVRLQMRSDVPVGLFLSSGIDSGALLAIMSQYSGTPIRTFTIGFEEGERSNETEGARELAAMFAAEHSEMIVSARHYQDYYQRYLWDLEEPVGNESAAAFYFVSRIASSSVKVALTGQGADEPWAGYHRHLGAKLSQVYSRLPSAVTESFGRVVEKYATNETLRRSLVSLGSQDVLSRFIRIYSFYSDNMKSHLFQPWVKDQISVDGAEAKQALAELQADVAHLDALTQILYLDTRTNLPDDLLMVSDKTAMTNSLEARVPFLDYRLVQFIETIPPGLKLRGIQGKYLHKKAVEKWLPKRIVYRKKKGFANPVAHWLRATMLQFMRECLLSEGAAVHRYFDKAYITRLIEEHQTNQKNHLRHLYLLISFELWHQQFMGPSSYGTRLNSAATSDFDLALSKA
jgi:asparagine synthase (glutamine-hydrolysing)